MRDSVALFGITVYAVASMRMSSRTTAGALFENRSWQTDFFNVDRATGRPRLPPPVIGGGDRLEVHGNDMGSGHKLRRVLLVSGAQMRPHLVGGLCELHAHSRELDGKLEAR